MTINVAKAEIRYPHEKKKKKKIAPKRSRREAKRNVSERPAVLPRTIPTRKGERDGYRDDVRSPLAPTKAKSGSIKMSFVRAIHNVVGQRKKGAFQGEKVKRLRDEVTCKNVRLYHTGSLGLNIVFSYVNLQLHLLSADEGPTTP